MMILVTAWRHHPDEHAIYAALDALWRTARFDERVFVLHGDCPTGGDNYAKTWCMSRGVPQITFPARRYGVWPWCGPKRNAAMVEYLASAFDAAKHVLAFPQPDWETARVSGTRNCITLARKAGFEPQIYPAVLAVPS